jgi:uncharacterized membrane protein YccC
VNSELVRNSLKLFTATFITAGVALWTERIEFLWYPLVAVVVVVDDSDDQTAKAASNRILGTAMGGLITFIVHTIVQGWVGVLVSLLVMIPVLRVLGWSGGLNTAGLLSVMFLMIPDYTALDWNYVFNRGLDTIVGCIIALLVGLLFWPRGVYEELNQSDAYLRGAIGDQLQRYRNWLLHSGPRPVPLSPAPLSSRLQRIETLVNQEQRSPRRSQLRRRGWNRRLLLWQQSHFHWLAWEQIMAELPEGVLRRAELVESSVEAMANEFSCGVLGSQAPVSLKQWHATTQREQLPLFPMLALAQEQQPLHGSLRALARSVPC